MQQQNRATPSPALAWKADPAVKAADAALDQAVADFKAAQAAIEERSRIVIRQALEADAEYQRLAHLSSDASMAHQRALRVRGDAIRAAKGGAA
jgi:hypothetical protein